MWLCSETKIVPSSNLMIHDFGNLGLDVEQVIKEIEWPGQMSENLGIMGRWVYKLTWAFGKEVLLD